MNKQFILTIDQGNTKISSVLFTEDKILDRASDVDQLLLLINRHQLSTSNCIVIESNVTKNQLDLINLEIVSISRWFKNKDFLSMPVNYEKTLGQDRLACAYYAYLFAPNSWIIDSGTFTTVDYISDQGFEGGFIFPGAYLIQDSYQNGANLFASSESFFSLPETLPQTSFQAITQGANLSIFTPISKALDLKPQKNILLTGGYGEKIMKGLEQYLPTASIHLQPDLLHLSLFEIAKKEL